MGFGLRVSFLVEKVSNIILYIILIIFINFFVMLLVAVLIDMNGYGDYLVWNGQKRGIQVVNDMVTSNDDRMKWSKIKIPDKLS